MLLGDAIRYVCEEQRVSRLFAPYSISDMRRFWDQCGEDSFYHGPEGSFDCADIHRRLNELGDGAYCAV
jgi:hypothetical protein